MGELRARVDARLASYFAEKRDGALAPEAVELLDAISELTMRGGKRLRPALLYAAFRSVAPDAPIDDVIHAGSAIELFQSYLLIHDDWMDADEERRGGPAVHSALTAAHGDAHLGASLAILAGNAASAHAWELLMKIEGPEARLRAAIEIFLAMHHEVFVGQQLDLLKASDVSSMQQLKTGSYTVRGPVALGAVLAGASPEQRAALSALSDPLGEAFQMRDDLLGTFGDPAVLGKPVGSDLRDGKRTSLMRAAERLASEAQLAVLRRGHAGEEQLARVRSVFVECGAKRAVEERLETLLGEAKAVLDTAPLYKPGTDMLRELADRLAQRDR
jgi:geranylgeranyl diphosphate synthase type I